MTMGGSRGSVDRRAGDGPPVGRHPAAERSPPWNEHTVEIGRDGVKHRAERRMCCGRPAGETGPCQNARRARPPGKRGPAMCIVCLSPSARPRGDMESDRSNGNGAAFEPPDFRGRLNPVRGERGEAPRAWRNG